MSWRVPPFSSLLIALLVGASGASGAVGASGAFGMFSAFGAFGASGVNALAQAPSQPPKSSPPGPQMTATAKGPFDVKLTPQGTATDPTAVGRMTLDKTFRGDLEATSAGEMLAVRTAVAGSAGYVAIERVSGTLAGRTGTFALQHWGVMDKGAPDLRISVIPDSGTGQLAGLTGTMTIDIQPGGKHFYTFTYTLPQTAP
jgi:hypothetical protein